MAKIDGPDPAAQPRALLRPSDEIPRGSRAPQLRAGDRRSPVPFDGPLGALVRFTSDGIMVVNRAGRTLFANQTAAHALGHTSIEALKRVPVEDVLGPFVVEDLDSTAKGPTVKDDNGDLAADFSREVWFAPHDQVVRFRDPAAGWDRWVRVRARPFVEQSGTHTAFLIIVQDVTSHRRATGGVRFLDEATRRLSQSLLRQRILEHAAVVAVPRLADECVIIERSAGKVWDPVAWYVPGGGAQGRAGDLVRNFAPLLAQVETGEHPLLVAPSREGIGLPLSGSMILVPIKRGSAVTGAMLLAMAPDTARCHHPADLALAEQFADRVAACLNNAELFESEQRRRSVLDERLANTRRLGERRDALLVSLAYSLSQQLGPVLQVADLLEGNDPNHLGAGLRLHAQRLRSVVDTLLEASRIPTADGDASRLEDQLRRIRALLNPDP
jgi:PAS domain-containing protein